MTDTEFELNAELREQAEDMLKTKVEQIKLQNQWGLAKSELELEKVHARFRAQERFQISANRFHWLKPIACLIGQFENTFRLRKIRLYFMQLIQVIKLPRTRSTN